MKVISNETLRPFVGKFVFIKLPEKFLKYW